LWLLAVAVLLLAVAGLVDILSVQLVMFLQGLPIQSLWVLAAPDQRTQVTVVQTVLMALIQPASLKRLQAAAGEVNGIIRDQVVVLVAALEIEVVVLGVLEQQGKEILVELAAARIYPMLAVAVAARVRQGKQDQMEMLAAAMVVQG
jgi:hypothetical protein